MAVVAERVSKVKSQQEGQVTLSPGAKIAIVCDAYDGQKEGGATTGVKRTLLKVSEELERRGFEVGVIYPGLFPEARKVKAPCAPELELRAVKPRMVRRFLEQKKPDAIFNKTPEGLLGRSASKASRAKYGYRIPMTGNYTTNHDDMLRAYVEEISSGRLKVDSLDPALEKAYNRALRKVYRDSERVMVPTRLMASKLEKAGIDKTVIWPRGVDSKLFRPLREGEQSAYDQYGWGENLPVLVYFGRVSKEKKIGEFVNLETPGYRKVVIGDGPDTKRLKKKYADENTHFLGKLHGEDLAHHIRSSSVMVFPSRFDTFGNVLLEAAASGVPAVAYDIPGSGEVLENGISAIYLPVGTSLKKGIAPAMELDRGRCAEVTIRKYTWEKTADILLNNLNAIEWQTQPSA